MTANLETLSAAVAERAEDPGRTGRTLTQAIREQEDQVARALSSIQGVDPQRFVRIVLTEIRKNPDIQACSVESILGSMMTAAQLGLEFGPLGHAYMIPYKQEVSLIIGYRGLIDLALRSGKIRTIVARPVYAGDEFDFFYDEHGDHLLHRPVAESKRGKPQGDGDQKDPGVVRYYARALLADGGSQLAVLEPEDVERRRKRSATRNSSRSPWNTDYQAMALKTVVRSMASYLPTSVELANALEADERVIRLDGSELVVQRGADDIANHGGREVLTVHTESLDEETGSEALGASDNQVAYVPPYDPETGETGDYGASDENPAEYDVPESPRTSGGVPEDVLHRAEAAVQAMDDDRVRATLQQFGKSGKGNMRAMRVLLLQEVSIRASHGDSAALDLI